MPPFSVLALRYVLWFIGLSFLYGVFVALAELPASLATGVILASAPAADVGLQATRRATRALRLADWGMIWGLCMGIYLLLSVIGPMILALFLSPVREGLQSAMLQSTLMAAGATAIMQALFLWIGHRAAGGPSRG